MKSSSGQDRGAVAARWLAYRGRWQTVEAEVIEEALVTLHVNGRELATIMCTPRDQLALGLGFLANEGLISGLGQVALTHVSQDGCCVDIWLTHPVELPSRRIVTSGCGGGVTFEDPTADMPALADDLRLSPEALVEALNALHQPGSLHARTRGVHAAGLSDGKRLLLGVEDVGRHNTVDKLLGLCLMRGVETRGRSLLTTGRVSSEMLRKAVRMGCPIVASRNSPTSLSVSLAEAWNVTLVGYVRRDSLRVYAHPERLGASGAAPGLRIPAAVSHAG